MSIIKEKGAQHWKEIALELSNRSGVGIFRQGKQCRERWINHLDPNVKKGSWTDEEDLLMLQLFLEKGKKWADIAKRLGGRTENNVKNRWISLIRKYKSELNFDNNTFDHETDETSGWEQKLVQSIIATRLPKRGEESHTSMEILTQNRDTDEHDLCTSFDTQPSPTILSPKSSEDPKATFQRSASSKKMTGGKKPAKHQMEIDLTPNVEEKECLKDKLNKNCKSHYDHLGHHELRQEMVSQLPKVNSRDCLAESFPKFEYPAWNYTSTAQRQSDLNQKLLTLKGGQLHPLPNNMMMQQEANTNVTYPLGFPMSNGLFSQTSNQMYCPPQLNQISTNPSEDELFHLAHKKIEKIPLEMQPDKEYLYFAMIDAKTHEIYLMSQVTQANYAPTFQAIESDNPEKQPENPDKSTANTTKTAEINDLWSFDVSKFEQEIPEAEISRNQSDFFLDFDEN